MLLIKCLRWHGTFWIWKPCCGFYEASAVYPCWPEKKGAGTLKDIVLGRNIKCINLVFEGGGDVKQIHFYFQVSDVKILTDRNEDQQKNMKNYFNIIFSTKPNIGVVTFECAAMESLIS